MGFYDWDKIKPEELTRLSRSRIARSENVMLAEVEVRRGHGLVELFGGFVKLSVPIGGGAGVEVQARVVALALQQLLVFFEGLLVLAGFVFAQGG